MTGISFQFHGTREELAPLLSSRLHAKGMVATIVGVRAGMVDRLWNGDIAALLEHPDSDVTLGWTLGSPKGGAGGLNDFLKRNSDSMIFVLGSFTLRGLTQCWLSVKSDDKKLVAVAQALKKDIVQITERGAIAVNPVSGATSAMPAYRYTFAARTAYENGVTILPAAGRIVIRLTSVG